MKYNIGCTNASIRIRSRRCQTPKRCHYDQYPQFASAISEMDRMSAVERHYNFVRQNEADYTDTPTCFDNDLHDSPSGIRGCVRLRRNRPVDIFYIYHNSPLITKRSAYIPGIRIRTEPAGSGFTTTNYLIRTSTIRPGLLFATAQPTRAASASTNQQAFPRVQHA